MAEQTSQKLQGFGPTALTVALLVALWGCAPVVSPEDVASLTSDIAAIRADIKAAQAEDAKYTGGLIKALIGTRIALLSQTEAMLQQRLKASTFGISLKYTVDGKVFVPPRNIELASVEQELANNAMKIKNQEAESERYSGGLVQALSLSTLATMRQTQAMLDQKRLALKYGLPQYLGFHTQNESAPATSRNTAQTDIPATSDEKEWRIVSVDSRVTESNNVWSKYAWKLTLHNDSTQAKVFTGTIEFQDSDGFIVDTGNATDMLVPARSEQVFTGFTLIRAEVAGNVARTLAKIGKSR